MRELELDLVVTHHQRAADAVVTVRMSHPAGEELPSWTPGAHVDLLLGPSLVRQYSLCGSPTETHEWTVSVLRDPHSRGGSLHVHDELTVGSSLRVRGPRNHFPLITSPRYQFIAGGIGITPMMSMIESVHARALDWHLLYGGRTRQSMAYLTELASFGDRVTIWPEDEHGRLNLSAVLDPPRADTLVYCCGPEPLLNAVESACAQWPAGSLQIERFAPRAIPKDQQVTAEDFEVVCARSGITVTVEPDSTILEALEGAGIEVLASCLSGICGTCETPVLQGVPDHRDSVLSDAEHETGSVIMVCVSRSQSKTMVLDL
jgi:ferredoxin-NADP reductase